MPNVPSYPPSLTHYPAYCFPLSPTYNTWVKLTAADVHSLQERPGFEGQRIYFYGNHPIRLVRLVGLVVAFDVFPNRFIFILDDSSGSNIEVTCGRPNCSLNALPESETVRNPPESIQEKVTNDGDAHVTGTTALGNTISLKGIDIGTVVKVKGHIGEFRGEKQILLERIWIVGTTNEEAVCWVELCEFRSGVLDKAWIVDERDEKTAKRRAEGKGMSGRQKVKNHDKNHCVDKGKKLGEEDLRRRSKPDDGRKSKHTTYGRTSMDKRVTTRQEHGERIQGRNGNSKQLSTGPERFEEQAKDLRVAGFTSFEALPIIANKKTNGQTPELHVDHCGEDTCHDSKKHPSRIHANANLHVTADALHMCKGTQAQKRKIQETPPFKDLVGGGDVQDKAYPNGLIEVNGEPRRDRSWAEGKFDALGF